MNIEYEATFLDINKKEIRKRLKDLGAKLVKPEFLQKRFNFIPPKILTKYSWIRVRDEGDKITMSYKAIEGDKIENQKEIEKYSWIRVRDEGDKITMSYKAIEGDKIENQKEIELIVSDFDKAIDFLETIGCKKKAYQENKRELWNLDNVEICIDEWPFLEPFVEVEGKSEKEVKAVSEKLGFDYSNAWFCAVGLIYSKKYNIPPEVIDNEIKEITFDIENPFLKIKKQ